MAIMAQATSHAPATARPPRVCTLVPFIIKALGHDIRADCEIASGCGFTTSAYALIENDVIDYSRSLSRA